MEHRFIKKCVRNPKILLTATGTLFGMLLILVGRFSSHCHSGSYSVSLPKWHLIASATPVSEGWGLF